MWKIAKSHYSGPITLRVLRNITKLHYKYQCNKLHYKITKKIRNILASRSSDEVFGALIKIAFEEGNRSSANNVSPAKQFDKYNTGESRVETANTLRVLVLKWLKLIFSVTHLNVLLIFSASAFAELFLLKLKVNSIERDLIFE